MIGINDQAIVAGEALVVEVVQVVGISDVNSRPGQKRKNVVHVICKNPRHKQRQG